MFFDFPKYSHNTAVITDRSEKLSYLELEQLSLTFSQCIHPGSFVFTLCENTIGSLIGYVSMLDNNISQVLLDASKGIEVIANLAEVYRPDFLWLPARVAENFVEAKLATADPIYTYSNYVLLKSCFTNKEKVNEELLLCLTTSGSTGSPKFVRLSKNNIFSNAESIAQYLSIDQYDRPITTLPMYYSFGMSVINSNLLKGATILLTDKAVVQKEFWEFLKENEATSISGVPYTYETLRMLRFFRMKLPYLKTMIQAGGKLNEAIVKEYAQFAKDTDKRFFVMYGQTEAAPRISYLPCEYTFDKSSSIGIAVPGGRIALLDTNGQMIDKPNKEGELIYYGPNVCMGYAENRADLAKGDENNSCLHTGDIAKFDADGFYYITGRMKRFVKVWGNRCNLDALEQQIKSITPRCACIGEDDKITIVLEDESLQKAVLNKVVDVTHFNINAFTVKVIDSMPMLASGKVDYSRISLCI